MLVYKYLIYLDNLSSNEVDQSETSNSINYFRSRVMKIDGFLVAELCRSNKTQIFFIY